MSDAYVMFLSEHPDGSIAREAYVNSTKVMAETVVTHTSYDFISGICFERRSVSCL